MFGDLKGEVVYYKIDYIYPLKVQFGEYIYSYTLDGRFNTNMNTTLSDQPYKVEYVPPKPHIELPEVGQWCWFRNNGNEGYYYGRFMCLNPNPDHYYQVECGMTFKYCSTTNPTENEKPN